MWLPNSTSSARTRLAGIALAWFLLFPSLGIVQKYLGTTAALAYACAGSLTLIGSLKWLQLGAPVEGRRFRWAAAALLGALALLFVVFYPMANAGEAPWLSPSGIAGSGSDRDEALDLGARALLAGRYPYDETTQLDNPISPMPGTLMAAVPFLIVGNVAWQNLVWFGVWLAVARRLLDGRTALTILGGSLLASPVILQEFVTGGDLITNSVIVFLALLLLWEQVPDPARPVWAKIAAAVFAGVALSSRSVYFLLLPSLFTGLVRRAGLRPAIVYLGIAAAAFSVVTMPFYWHDPAAFAPLQVQNKFVQFETAIPGSRWVFPGLSLALAVALACVRGNVTTGVWLMQCGLVLTFPIALFVMLATAEARWPILSSTSYALSGLVFGTLGAALYLREGRKDRHGPRSTPDGPLPRQGPP